MDYGTVQSGTVRVLYDIIPYPTVHCTIQNDRQINAINPHRSFRSRDQ